MAIVLYEFGSGDYIQIIVKMIEYFESTIACATKEVHQSIVEGYVDFTKTENGCTQAMVEWVSNGDSFQRSFKIFMVSFLA